MYKDLTINESTFIRTIKTDTSPDDLVWHYDEIDRNIEVLSGVGWFIQFDNEKPIQMNKNDNFFIKKGIYHRVIFNKKLGSEDLKIKIEENKNGNS